MHKRILLFVNVTHTKQSKGSAVDQQRETRIVVRVSVIEKRKFEKMAKDRYTDISELIRQLLHREADMKAERA